MLNEDFDLQLFTDDGAAAGTEDSGTQEDAKSAEGSGKQDKAENSGKEQQVDSDALVAAKVAEAQKKWEKDYKAKEKAKKAEAERLSKLSEDERRKAELENSRKELEAKEKELTQKELKLEMVKELSDRKLRVKFMDYLIAEDNDSTLKRITAFEKQYKKAIEDAVNEKLKGRAPKAGTNASAGGQQSARGAFFEAIYKNQVKR